MSDDERLLVSRVGETGKYLALTSWVCVLEQLKGAASVTANGLAAARRRFGYVWGIRHRLISLRFISNLACLRSGCRTLAMLA